MDGRRLPRFSIPRKRAMAHLCLSLLLVLGTAACAQVAREDAAFDPATAERVLSRGFDSISQKYIRPVTPRDMAVEALDGLADIDPRLTSSRADGRIRMARDGEIVETALPDDTRIGEWAHFTVGMIEAARTMSPELHIAPAEKVYKAAFGRIMDTLDSHSRYAGLRSARQYRAQRDGFGGLGIRLNFENGLPVVIAVLEDTPAEAGGIRAGDVITHLDGLSLAGWPRDEVIWHLRGRIGSTAHLKLRRDPDQMLLEIPLRRGLIISPTVSLARRGDVAVIAINSFNQRTGHELERALARLHPSEDATEGPVRGIILDLRGNPGGLLDQSVKVADAFLARGRIVTTHGRHPDSFQVFNATGRQLAENIPMAVLINGQSASAAEIVAAALQDHGRAVVIGTNSYGKGTVQNITALPNGGELILTWSRFHAPSGYALDQLGVLPNICTASPKPDTEKPAIERAVFRDSVFDPHIMAENAVRLASWRSMSLADNEGRTAMRTLCPRQSQAPEEDIAFATELLADNLLYARALGIAAPRVAGTPHSAALGY